MDRFPFIDSGLHDETHYPLWRIPICYALETVQFIARTANHLNSDANQLKRKFSLQNSVIFLDLTYEFRLAQFLSDH